MITIREGKGGWRWAFTAKNGKQTANNETHPTRRNAIRAAKSVVTGILRQWVPRPVILWTATTDSRSGVTTITFTNVGTQ